MTADERELLIEVAIALGALMARLDTGDGDTLSRLRDTYEWRVKNLTAKLAAGEH